MLMTKISLLLADASLFLTDAAGAADGTGEVSGWASLISMFIWLIPLGAVFYFMIIRPESKRKKAATKLRSELIVSDEVTTIGGIVGKVVQIKDDEITIETGSERSRIKIMRWAISSKGQQVSDK